MFDSNLIIDPLLSALNQEDTELKINVIATLTRFKDVKVVKALIELIFDREDAIKKSAVEALGKIGHPMSIDALCVATKAVDIHIALSAVIALKSFKEPRTIPYMIQALYSYHWEIAYHAQKALISLASEDDVIDIIKVLFEPQISSSHRYAINILITLSQSKIDVVEKAKQFLETLNPNEEMPQRTKYGVNELLDMLKQIGTEKALHVVGLWQQA